jgi:hypothetical protein
MEVVRHIYTMAISFIKALLDKKGWCSLNKILGFFTTLMCLPLAANAQQVTDMPIDVTLCDARPMVNAYGNANPGQLTIGVTFRVTGTVAATAIQFKFVAVDAFNKVLGTLDTETFYGTFSPSIVIEPRKALNGNLIVNSVQPTSPAWNVYNSYGNNAGQVFCTPWQAKFADGTVWSHPPVARVF